MRIELVREEKKKNYQKEKDNIQENNTKKDSI